MLVRGTTYLSSTLVARAPRHVQDPHNAFQYSECESFIRQSFAAQKSKYPLISVQHFALPFERHIRSRLPAGLKIGYRNSTACRSCRLLPHETEPKTALSTWAGRGRFGCDMVGCSEVGFRPLSRSARWRRIVNAKVDDSSLSASAVLVGRDSGRRREGRGTAGLDQQI